MPPALTDMEQKILDFMVQYLRQNTYQPSIREIGERFDIKSTKTVSEHLQALADKGYLERDPSRSRGVRILGVDLHPQTVSLPCYARLPEDRNRLQTESAEMFLTIDRRLAGEKGGFFVRARESDLPALGVSEGDYVLIEPLGVEELEDGALVAARVGESPGFYQYATNATNGKGAVLKPLTGGERPTHVEDPGSITLLGRIAAVYRKMDGRGPVNVTPH